MEKDSESSEKSPSLHARIVGNGVPRKRGLWIPGVLIPNSESVTGD